METEDLAAIVARIDEGWKRFSKKLLVTVIIVSVIGVISGFLILFRLGVDDPENNMYVAAICAGIVGLIAFELITRNDADWKKFFKD